MYLRTFGEFLYDGKLTHFGEIVGPQILLGERSGFFRDSGTSKITQETLGFTAL